MKRLYISAVLISLFILFSCGDNSTDPAPTELTLTAPAGGEFWLIGGTVEITWTAKNAGEKVKIELSRDAGETWQIVAEEAANTGSFIWDVVSPESETTFIRLTDISSNMTASHDIPVKIKSLGHLDVEFFLEYVADPYPTYQTTVWLEDKEGHFVRSLFVSDWLARGGYVHRYVCSTWSRKANWTEGQTEDIDAVTGATPDWGVDNVLHFDLKALDLAPGIYDCNMESHITGDYNIFYSGQLEIEDTQNSVEPTPVYIPEQHAIAGQVLKNVKMNYFFLEPKEN